MPLWHPTGGRNAPDGRRIRILAVFPWISRHEGDGSAAFQPDFRALTSSDAFVPFCGARLPSTRYHGHCLPLPFFRNRSQTGFTNAAFPGPARDREPHSDIGLDIVKRVCHPAGMRRKGEADKRKVDRKGILARENAEHRSTHLPVTISG